MGWILPLISNSSSLFSRPLRTVASTPTTIGITITFIFHSLFSSLARSKYLSIISVSFIFTVVCLKGKNTKWQVFFLLIKAKSDLLAGIEWSICIWKSQNFFESSFSNTDSVLCIYHLSVWSNFNLLHNSQWITFPTQSCSSCIPFV